MTRTFLRANVTELVQCSHITPRAGHSCNKPVATMPGRKRKRDVVPKTDAALSVSPLVALLRSGDLSILGAIKHELPEVFAAEILPKLDMEATLNLAQVNKFYNKTVWSVDGVRSLGAKLESAFEKLKHASKALAHPLPTNTTQCIYRTDTLGSGTRQLARGQGASGLWGGRGQGCDLSPDLSKYALGLRASSTEGQIALQCAAKKGHLAVVKALIEAGADVNKQDHYGNTALGAATAQGSTLVVMELIKAGADVNLTVRYGLHPHLQRCRRGKFDNRGLAYPSRRGRAQRRRR